MIIIIIKLVLIITVIIYGPETRSLRKSVLKKTLNAGIRQIPRNIFGPLKDTLIVDEWKIKEKTMILKNALP